MPEIARQRVIDIATTPEDELSRLETVHFIGKLLNGSLVEVGCVEEPQTTLDMLRNSELDPEAFLAVAANVHTELVEWKYKVGNIVSVRSSLDDQGIVQHGHRLSHIHANTILHRSAEGSVVASRAAPEALNFVRLENEARIGRLNDYWFLTMSAVSEAMTADEADKSGFFGETMSVALQATTADRFGLLTESAFVAGCDMRDGQRFDMQTLHKIYEYFGIEASSLGSEDILAKPLLVHKALMPNGVSDIVKLYDELAGGIRFFGTANKVGDYSTFADDCSTREEILLATAEHITRQLIAEKDKFTSPMDLTKRMTYLVKHQLIEDAFYDKTIDPIIFGFEAAQFIEQIRLHTHEQDITTGYIKELMENAHKTAKGGACGNYLGTEPSSETKEDGDWSGGKKEKIAKCKSCKSYKFEIGACSICEDCVGKPWVMQKAWNDMLKAEKKRREQEQLVLRQQSADKQKELV